MAYTFAEGLVDEIVDYLDANMGAKQDTISLAINDGIELEEVKDYIRRDPSDIRSLRLIPACFVVVPSTLITNWKETSAMQAHDLWIYLIARNPDPEVLRKMIYRYGRALWETLVDYHYQVAQGVPSTTWKIAGQVAPRIDFSETITRQNMSMADVKVELVYEKLETE